MTPEVTNWKTEIETIDGGRGQKCALQKDGARLSYARALELWRDDATFRAHFTRVLADAPWPAYRWETPPVVADQLDRDFEFVLLPCPGLARLPDRNAFAEKFQPNRDIVTFGNLGGDAVLVVPCPLDAGPTACGNDDDDCYAHLAAFVRAAPETQIHHLWQAVGQAVRERLSNRAGNDFPLWLSTAGMGVSWLHVRLDSRPKYYAYAPYKQRP